MWIRKKNFETATISINAFVQFNKKVSFSLYISAFNRLNASNKHCNDDKTATFFMYCVRVSNVYYALLMEL